MQATKIRAGMNIIYNGDLYKVLKVAHITPGNKRGKVQTEIRNIKTGVKAENRFRSEDEVERAVFQTKEMEYLYNEQDNVYYFMDTETYEQFQMDKESLGDATYYLTPNAKVLMDMYEGSAVGVELPKTVDLKVTETDPPLRGATASSSYKPAMMSNGLTVKVPPFVKVGDLVRVDTESSEYVERVS